jgi:hypothetical protein
MDTKRQYSGLIVRTLGAAALVAGCASTAGTNKAVTPTGLQKEETSIPFVRMEQSIHDWQANGEVGLWIQDGRRDWYYAKLLGPCFGLEWAVGAVITSRGSQLDRYGSVLVAQQSGVPCQFMSFVRSDPPPSKAKKGDAEASKTPAPATTPPGG